MSETIQTKYCSKCKKTLPLSEFYTDQSRRDNLQPYCKSCHKAYKQSEKGKAVHHKAVAKYNACHPNCMKAYRQSERGKAAMRKGNAKFHARNPNYRKAVGAANHAIRDGRLPRPDTLLCYYCPKPAQQYHHYLGYEPENWLDVVPTCVNCHRKEHRKIA